MYGKDVMKGKRIKNKLGIILKEKNISQREFSRITGLRQATVNEIANNKRGNINIEHLLIIMCYFDTSDFNFIFEIIEVDELIEEKKSVKI